MTNAQGLLPREGRRRSPQIPDEQRRRLVFLVRSARASALSSKQEALLERDGNAVRESEEFRCIAAQIATIVRELDEIPTPEGGEDRESYELALAAAENAHGRSLHLMGDYQQALTVFQQARARVPDMVDPYIGIAAAYLKLKQEGDRRWAEHTEDALEKALELSPLNEKAHYYFGRLEAERGNYEAAKQHFEAGGRSHHWNLYQLARIAHLEGDDDLAVRHLRGSIKLLQRPDVRYELFIRCVLRKAQRQPPVELSVLREAERYGKALQKAGEDRAAKTRAGKLLARVVALLSGEETDPDPDDPGPM
ncbi:MAG TPA: hypothetical protein VF746_05340 [Longimicrobium sp.]|jgi:tetratricopeptide (TPR) repeat protein